MESEFDVCRRMAFDCWNGTGAVELPRVTEKFTQLLYSVKTGKDKEFIRVSDSATIRRDLIVAVIKRLDLTDDNITWHVIWMGMNDEHRYHGITENDAERVQKELC